VETVEEGRHNNQQLRIPLADLRYQIVKYPIKGYCSDNFVLS
jgi:hypothetical protein